MEKTLIGLLGLLAVAPTIWAADNYSISFLPPTPLAGQAVVAHVASNVGKICSIDPGSILRSGSTITLSVKFDDFCLPEAVTYRDFALGPLAAGGYVVVFQACGDNPPPFPSDCHNETEAQLFVGRVRTDSAPVNSTWGLLALAMGLVAAALGSSSKSGRAR
jgi:hypothetical protein